MPSSLIIGASRGIGFELTKQLLNHGHHVHATCRTLNDNLQYLKEISGGNINVYENIDVREEKSVENLGKGMKENEVKLDNLICMAGVWKHTTRVELVNAKDLMEAFQTNCVGPLLVGKHLKSQMNDGSHFLAVSTVLASVQSNTNNPMFEYTGRISKAALNMGMRSLANEFGGAKRRGKGDTSTIRVNCIHPGFVKTEMTKGRGDITPEQSAELISQFLLLNNETTGKFINVTKDNQEIPW